MASAKKTTAIVNSLFPENVRDRRLADISGDEATKNNNSNQAGGKRTSWTDPSGAFVHDPNPKQSGYDMTSEKSLEASPLPTFSQKRELKS